MKDYPYFLPCFFAVALSACGGGGSSESEKDIETTVPEGGSTVEMTEGGTPSTPTYIDFDGLNEISADHFFNNFKLDVQEGDELIITATLAGDIDTRKVTACSANPSAYTGIRLSDNIRSCSRHFRHVFTDFGEKQIKFGFPDENYGFFAASIVKAGQDPILLQSVGEGGVPDAVGQINFDGENTISENSFFNNYGYFGQAGETIYLRAYVNPGELDKTAVACSANGSYGSSSSFGWSVLNANYLMVGEENHGPRYSCSDYMEYTFEEDGLYRFNFRSTVNGTGFFLATVTPNPL